MMNTVFDKITELLTQLAALLLAGVATIIFEYVWVSFDG